MYNTDLDTKKLKKTGKRGIPQGFPRILHRMLNNQETRCITWSSTENHFWITDTDYFVTNVLPKYFRHSKLTSFQRQLNLYGFSKVSKGKYSGAYTHKYFTKSGDNINNIRRSASKSIQK